MARAKIDFTSLAKRTRTASRGLSSQDEGLQAQPADLPHESAREVKLREIKGRPSGDTREINPIHALELALSVEALGLIEPLVIDRDHHLLAGGHRLTALQLLAPQTREPLLETLRAHEGLSSSQAERLEELAGQLPDQTTINLRAIPVRVFDFSAREDAARALEVETSENTLRRDYTPAELLELYERLLSMGYEDVRGRPSSTQRPVKPALALIIGQSLRTVQRKLKAAQEDAERDEVEREVSRLESAIRQLSKRLESASPSARDRLSASPQIRARVSELTALLRDLK